MSLVGHEGDSSLGSDRFADGHGWGIGGVSRSSCYGRRETTFIDGTWAGSFWVNDCHHFGRPNSDIEQSNYSSGANASLANTRVCLDEENIVSCLGFSGIRGYGAGSSRTTNN